MNKAWPRRKGMQKRSPAVSVGSSEVVREAWGGRANPLLLVFFFIDIFLSLCFFNYLHNSFFLQQLFSTTTVCTRQKVPRRRQALVTARLFSCSATMPHHRLQARAYEPHATIRCSFYPAQFEPFRLFSHMRCPVRGPCRHFVQPQAEL